MPDFQRKFPAAMSWAVLSMSVFSCGTRNQMSHIRLALLLAFPWPLMAGTLSDDEGEEMYVGIHAGSHRCNTLCMLPTSLHPI